MVLVRKSELACRNFMDQALWEPADNPDDLSDFPDTMIPDPSDVPGEYAADISMEASQRSRSSRTPNDHTDQITSIAMPVHPLREPERPQRQISFGADRISGTGSDNPSDVRDAQRRRHDEQARRKRPTDGLLDDAGTLLDRLSAAETSGIPVDGSAPSLRNADSPPSTRYAAPPTDADDPLLVARRRKHDRAPLVPPTPPQPPRDAIAFNGDGAVDIEAAMPVPKPAPVQIVTRASKVDGGTEPFTIVASPPRYPVGSASVATEIAESAQMPSSIENVDGSRGSASPESARGSDSHIARRAESRSEQLIQPRVDRVRGLANVATHLPLAVDPIEADPHSGASTRRCATCRDFQPEGDGTRGKCRNVYAFAQPRMVKSDELACRSSIGVWWLPRDDFWLERAESAQTIRPEGLLGGLAHSLAVDRSGAGTQRRGEL